MREETCEEAGTGWKGLQVGERGLSVSGWSNDGRRSTSMGRVSGHTGRSLPSGKQTMHPSGSMMMENGGEAFVEDMLDKGLLCTAAVMAG